MFSLHILVRDILLVLNLPNSNSNNPGQVIINVGLYIPDWNAGVRNGIERSLGILPKRQRSENNRTKLTESNKS
jgi:hypothetical protein